MLGKTWGCVGAMVIGTAAMLAGCEGEGEVTPTPTPAATPTQALLARSPTGTPTARTTPSPTSPSATLPPPAAGETPLAPEVLIQNEIARLQKVGFTVDEVIKTSLDGTNQHVAMRVAPAHTENFDSSQWEGVLQFSSPTPSDGIPGQQALLLYEVNGEELARIFDRLDFYISLQSEYGQPPLGDLDIDANGVRELVVSASNGANCWECGRLVIYTVRDHEVTEVPIDLPATGLLGYDGNGDGTSAVPMRLEDLDGDGRYEVIALDASWELHGFCHGCSPSAVFVLAWDGQRYRDVSSRFPDYFQSRIEEAEGILRTVDTRDFGSGDDPEHEACLRDQGYMSTAVSILLNYGHSGRAQEGWTRYSEATKPAELKSQVWRDLLATLEEDLELSVPRNGRSPTSSVGGSPLLGGLACFGDANR